MSAIRRSRSYGAFVAAIAAATCVAQAPAPNANRLADPDTAVVSRWAADVARIDADLQMRSLVADDPRGHWIAGHFDPTDVGAQVRHYAAARVAAPNDALYLSSLAIACQQPAQPVPAECAAVDRLSDWARRDADNGAPLLILAEKAAKRGNNDAAIAFLEQASALPRQDDYTSRGALAFWEYIAAMPIDAERAARAQAAAAYAAAQPQDAALALAAACGGAQSAASEARRAACVKAGAAVAERGSTFVLRAAGATAAERNAADGASAGRIRAPRAANDALRARCAAQALDWQQAMESVDAAVRTRAVAAFDAAMRAQGARGEVAACAQRGG